MRISRVAALAAAALVGGTAIAAAQTDPAAVTALRGRLPPAVGTFCAAAASGAPTTIPEANAQWDCDLPTSIGVIARYATFGTSEAMSAGYARVLKLAGLPGDVLDIGGCAGTTSIGEHVWTDAGGPAGRMACSLQDGGIGTPASLTPVDPHAHVVWTSTDTLTLVWGTRNDIHLDRLVTDWLPTNLPSPPIIITGPLPVYTASNAGQFPNSAERALIKSLSSNIDHNSCRRVTQAATDKWAMGIQCGIPVTQGGGGIVIRAFTKKGQAQADYRSVVKQRRVRHNLNAVCKAHTLPTEHGFKGGGKSVGRYVCFHSGKNQVRLDWYDARQQVHGTIVQPGGNPAASFLWWQRNVRQH